MARWRRSFYRLVPSWLSSGDGEKVLYTLGRLTDGFVERARRSLTARFPTYSGPTGLALLGDERGIVKGRGESNAGYARRLRGWRGPNGHQVRGSPFAVLRQIWNYFDGIKAQTIDTSSNVYTVEQDGTESATHGGAWYWYSSPPVATPAHDADAASDIGTGVFTGAGSLLLSATPGTAGTITVNCDGAPGRLIFLTAATGQDNPIDVLADGWNLLAENLTYTGSGVTPQYVHRVYWKIVGPYESFTTVDVRFTQGGGLYSNRCVARAVNVPGRYRATDLILETQTAESETLEPIEIPALAGNGYPALGLAFVAGRTGTYSAATDWTELGSERVAGGPRGIGIDEQYRTVPADGSPAATVGTSGHVDPSTSVIAVTIRQHTDQEWWRFWLKLVPTVVHGITSWGPWSSLPFGPTWADAAGKTWGQAGVTPGDAAVIKNLFRGDHPWKPAGTKPEWAIVVLGEEDDHEPDGTWSHWTHDGAPSRPATWRFWKL